MTGWRGVGRNVLRVPVRLPIHLLYFFSGALSTHAGLPPPSTKLPSAPKLALPRLVKPPTHVETLKVTCITHYGSLITLWTQHVWFCVIPSNKSKLESCATRLLIRWVSLHLRFICMRTFTHTTLGWLSTTLFSCLSCPFTELLKRCLSICYVYPIFISLPCTFSVRLDSNLTLVFRMPVSRAHLANFPRRPSSLTSLHLYVRR